MFDLLCRQPWAAMQRVGGPTPLARCIVGGHRRLGRQDLWGDDPQPDLTRAEIASRGRSCMAGLAPDRLKEPLAPPRVSGQGREWIDNLSPVGDGVGDNGRGPHVVLRESRRQREQRGLHRPLERAQGGR